VLCVNNRIATRQLRVVHVVRAIQNQRAVIDHRVQRLIRMLNIDVGHRRLERRGNQPIRFVTDSLVTQRCQFTLDTIVIGRGNVVTLAALLGRATK